MKDSFQIGDQHRRIINDTESDYGFDVVAWKEKSLRIECSV